MSLTDLSPNDAHIQKCQNNVMQRLMEHPDKGLSTSSIHGSVEDGLICNITQGQHHVAMDLSAGMGGTATAPTPGFYAKAGLVGCLAIATKMTAARQGIPVRSVHVDIETDTDNLAIFGQGGRNAAPLDTRVRITIDSDAPDTQIDDLVTYVLSIDTWYLALRNAQSVSVDWVRPDA